MNAIECGVYLPNTIGRDVYAVHQKLWSLLSHQKKGEGGRGYIFRLLNAGDRFMALVRVDPKWRHQLHAAIPQVDTKVPFQSIDQLVAINVRLAPYMHSGTKYCVPSDLTLWATQLFARHGFAVNSLDLGRAEPFAHNKPGHQYKLQTRQCSVVARITDLHAAQNAWLNGIGRARAYGAGMLVAG